MVISPPGAIVHIAGQVAWSPEETSNAEGREAQFRQVLKQVITGVEAAGGSADDIQMLRFYIPNFLSGTEADMIARVLVETFGSENPPASSWIGVQALAQPEFLIEIEATAVLPA